MCYSLVKVQQQAYKQLSTYHTNRFFRIQRLTKRVFRPLKSIIIENPFGKKHNLGNQKRINYYNKKYKRFLNKFLVNQKNKIKKKIQPLYSNVFFIKKKKSSLLKKNIDS